MRLLIRSWPLGPTMEIEMRRKQRPSGEYVFFEDRDIELTLTGQTTYIPVEIEYTAKPGHSPSYDDPGAPPEIEIVGISPYVELADKANPDGPKKKHFLDVPNWLVKALEDLIDVDSLRPDFSQDE
jgi:hypothetical protein